MIRSTTRLLDSFPQEPRQKTGLASWYTPGLSDGVGDRLLMFDNTSAAPLELLRFRPEFSARAGFETALRHRVKSLERFRHPSVARVRSVQWLGDGEGLALISNQVEGQRLSEVLPKTHGPGFAMGLIRQLAPAIAALQEHGDGVAHGLISPERIVIGPDGRLVLVEHVIGAAVNTLGLTSRQLQVELGLAVPPSSGAVLLDRTTDVLQLAFVALSLLLGRRLDPLDYPRAIGSLLDEYSGSRPRGTEAPARLRPWLERALQLDGSPFESALDAHDALNELVENASHRNFVSLYGAGDVAGALAPTMPKNQHLATHDTDDRAAITPWPVAPATDSDFFSELEPRPALTELRRLEPVRDPAPKRRLSRMSKVGLAALALLVIAAQGVIITVLMLRRSQPAPPPTDPVMVASLGAAGSAPTPPPPATPPAIESSTPPVTAAVPTTPPPTPPPATTGGLEVTSDPPGAKVTVDGERRGVTPMKVQLPPGQHVVVVSDGKTTTTRSVTVAAGGSSTFVAALGPVAASAGWITIESPVELQVLEEGVLLGTTQAARIMLPAGKHQLDVANSTLGFQSAISVEVQPGKTATVAVPVPNGKLSVNALPWATVLVDGRAIGTTPLANIEIPVGSHEVIWRHPQLGERRQTVVVTLKAPVRLVMDLSK